MALSVNFAFTDALLEKLATFRSDLKAYRALIVVVDKETLDAGTGPTMASADVEADFAQIRESLKGLDAAFVVLSWDEKLTLITFTPEGLKPKMRMIYAASSSHLRQEARISGDAHVGAVAEITPALYGHKSGDRVELQTDKEKIQAQIAVLQKKECDDALAAPARGPAMHGMQSSVSADASAAAIAVSKKENAAAVLTVGSAGGAAIVLEKAFQTGASIDEIIAAIPADEPRFIVLAWTEDRTILAYVCPDGCKPKIRMPFAAMKPSLLGHLRDQGIALAKSIELSTVEAFEAQINDSLVVVTEEPKAAAPAKSTMVKGPRMFMPE